MLIRRCNGCPHEAGDSPETWYVLNTISTGLVTVGSMGSPPAPEFHSLECLQRYVEGRLARSAAK